MSLKISSSPFEDELKSSFLNEELEEYIENVKKENFKDESSTCIIKCQKDFMMPFTLNIIYLTINYPKTQNLMIN
jgi:hypothetical protein